jgi:hypothetical protein
MWRPPPIIYKGVPPIIIWFIVIAAKYINAKTQVRQMEYVQYEPTKTNYYFKEEQDNELNEDDLDSSK